MHKKLLLALVLALVCCTGKELIVVKSAQASSVLQPRKGDRFAAANLVDKTNRSWCEGQKDFGKNVTLSFELQNPLKASSFFIRNGYGWGQYWADNNRVKELRIEAEKGEAVVTLQDTDELQEVKFPKLPQSDTLKMTILSVYPGTKGHDTCIAEIAFNRQDDYDTSFTLDIPKTDWRILEKVGDRFWGVIQQQGRKKRDFGYEVEEYRVEINANGRMLSKERQKNNESIEKIIALGEDHIFVQKYTGVTDPRLENRLYDGKTLESRLLILDKTGLVKQEIQLANRRVVAALRTHDNGVLLMSAKGKYPALDLARVDNTGKLLWQRSILDTVNLPRGCQKLANIRMALRNSHDDGLILSFDCKDLTQGPDANPWESEDKALILALDQNFTVAWSNKIQHKTEEFYRHGFIIGIEGMAAWGSTVIAIGNVHGGGSPHEGAFAYRVAADEAIKLLESYPTSVDIAKADLRTVETVGDKLLIEIREKARRFENLLVSGQGTISIFETELTPYGEGGFRTIEDQKFSYFSSELDANGRKISRKPIPGLPIPFIDQRVVIFKSDTTRRGTVEANPYPARLEPALVQKIFKVTRDGRMLVL